MALFARAFASARSARLRRRLAAITAATRSKVRRRLECRERLAALGTLRAALATVGIAPEDHAAVRFFARAAREPARDGGASSDDGSGDAAPEARAATVAAGAAAVAAAADAAFIAADPKLAARKSLLACAIERGVAAVAELAAPPDGASPLDWYAWALAVLSPARLVAPGCGNGAAACGADGIR